MTEKQKRFLIKKQDIYSLLDFADVFKITPQEVYECYSEMLRSGEYHEYYENKWL